MGKMGKMGKMALHLGSSLLVPPMTLGLEPQNQSLGHSLDDGDVDGRSARCFVFNGHFGALTMEKTKSESANIVPPFRRVAKVRAGSGNRQTPSVLHLSCILP